MDPRPTIQTRTATPRRREPPARAGALAPILFLLVMIGMTTATALLACRPAHGVPPGPLPTPATARKAPAAAGSGAPKTPKPLKDAPVSNVPAPREAIVAVRWSAAAGSGPSGAPRGFARWVVGRTVLQLSYPTLAEARREAESVGLRLVRVASTRASLAQVSSGSWRGGAALRWNGRVLMPVTPAQARDAGLEPAELVGRWVLALRRVSQDARRAPALPSELVLPQGEERLLALPGAWMAPDGLRSSDPRCVALSAGKRGHDLRLSGLGAGASAITITRKGRSATFDVRVLPRAGSLPARVDLAVAGSSPDPEFLDLAIDHQVGHLARVADGAELVTYMEASSRALIGGSLPLTAWLEGNGRFPVVERVLVTGRAASQAFSPPQRLAASNHPEQIESDGPLLDVALGPGNSAYYYHHQNPTGAPPRYLQVRLENRSSTPSLMLVTPSGAGPSRDELYAGHLATWRYLRWMTRGNGWLVRLGPGERYLLDERLLRARDVGCGMGQVEVCQGVPPRWVVEAVAAGPAEASPGATAPPPLPSLPVVRGRGVFPAPLQELSARYEVDGPYAFIPVGGPPFQQPLGEGTPNIGNYGVEYRVRLALHNATATERRVYVVFGVAGGVARGSLVVDGRLVETPVLSTAVGRTREFGLADYLLRPGETREVLVRAFPEPGSNYPVRLIAKPLPANQ